MRCVLCGYDKCAGALHFHHLDPSEKLFAIEPRGGDPVIRRGCAAEARKCILLCANCHAEVEAGLTDFARRSNELLTLSCRKARAWTRTRTP